MNDELLEHAVELTGDRALAAQWAAEARHRSEDLEEQKRLIAHFAELAEARKRETAARRVEQWKALRPKAALVAAPVVVAFLVGLAGGTGAGMVQLKDAPVLPFGGPPVAVERELRFQHPGGLVAVVVHARTYGASVPLFLNASPVASGLGAETLLPPEVMLAGAENRVRFGGQVEDAWLEAVPVPSMERDALISAAAGLTSEAHDADVAATPSRYQAWMKLRAAKVLLELAPGERPAAYQNVISQLSGASARLDEQCNRILDEVRGAEPDFGRIRLELVKDLFPGEEHWCRREAEALRVRLGF